MTGFVAFIVFLFAWTFFSAILVIIFCKEKPIDKLKYFDEEYKMDEKAKSFKKDKLGIRRLISYMIPKACSNSGYMGRIEAELVKADIPITAQELIVIKLLSSFVFLFLCYAAVKNIFILLIVLVAVWNTSTIIIASKKKDRIKKFDSQLNEGIMIVSNSLKAGYSFMQAIAVTTEETGDPFSKEFKKMLKEMSLGIAEEDAIKNLTMRIESEDLKLVANAILIQKDVGGNLSEILDNISETIRERMKIKGELKTLTAQGKLSGIIVIMIPVFMGVGIYIFNRDYIMLLFTSPIGLAMLAASVINQILGVLMIRKIIKIDM